MLALTLPRSLFRPMSVGMAELLQSLTVTLTSSLAPTARKILETRPASALQEYTVVALEYKKLSRCSFQTAAIGSCAALWTARHNQDQPKQGRSRP